MEIQIVMAIMLFLIIVYLGYQEYKKRTIKPQGYCPKCGAALMELTEFCPYCGYKLKEEPKKEVQKPKIVTEDTGTQFFIDQDQELTQSLVNSKAVLSLEININSSKTEIEVFEFPCIIGRLAGECGVLIEEPAVGRRHASLEHDENGFWITDLQSHNGSYVNGAKIEALRKVKIKQGDKIKIGRAEITVL